MYRYLYGEIVEMSLDHVTIDVHGVGYWVEVSGQTLGQVTLGARVKLYTKQLVREDEHVLCGFFDDNERMLFEHLLSVSGIGRKVAMGMLSKAPYARLLEWLITGNEKELTQLPGLGKKTAQRLIVELKDKLKKLYGTSGFDQASESYAELNLQGSISGVEEDVFLALSSLGFKRDEINLMLKGIDLSQVTVEKAIQLALTQRR